MLLAFPWEDWGGNSSFSWRSDLLASERYRQLHPFLQVQFLQTLDPVGIAHLGYLAGMSLMYQAVDLEVRQDLPGHSRRGTGIILSGCEQLCSVIKSLYASTL
jgi:hypothetical protein